MKRHCGTALNITDLVAARGRVAINVEELSNVLAVLGEERVVASLFPLLIEVHDMVGFRSEKFSKLLVGEELIEHKDFIDNKSLMEEMHTFRMKDLTYKQDFVLLPKYVYYPLSKWYSCEKEITRSVI